MHVEDPSEGGRPVYSVGELGRRLRDHLERRTAGVRVRGEVTGLKGAESGHLYFALRDDREEASIDCVLYRSAAVRMRRLVVEGARLVLSGRITFWPPRGRVQFMVETVQAEGRGALLEMLEKRKQKLAAEGLFDRARKRPLPASPRVVGVVTSGSGAVLHDIVKVAFARGPARILLSPAPVQGAGAAAALVRALTKLLAHPEVDVVILGRGGGSQDDLAPFQEEELVRAVAAARVPIVSAVGHEVDTSLVDLAADVRAATPSQAAELVVADARASLTQIDLAVTRLRRFTERALRDAGQRTDELAGGLERALRDRIGRARAESDALTRRLTARHPSRVLREAREDIQARRSDLERSMTRLLRERGPLPRDAEVRLTVAIQTRLAEERALLGRRSAELSALSPLAVLGRGFAVARREGGEVVTDASALSPGDKLRLAFARGAAEASVVRVEDDAAR